MLSFLFWNLKKLPRAETVACLAREHDIDVLVLAECVVPDTTLLKSLHEMTHHTYSKSWSESSSIEVFTRLPEDSIFPLYDDSLGRLTIRHLKLDSLDVLLAAVHFPSKVNWTDDEQRAELQNLARDIDRVENDEGHRRTILVGDFNTNPFEKAMISSHGLHAVMTEQVAKQNSRRVQGREYPFFYNPMWGLFGDRTRGPAGTHYFRRATPDVYFWNMFDQVLVRPELISLLNNDVTVVDTVDGIPLGKNSNGIPDVSVGSDHFPLHFRLQISEG